MVQRFEIGAEVVKPSLFFQGEPNSKSNDDEMAFRVKTDRLPEEEKKGEDEEGLLSLVFGALRNCGIKFRRRRRRRRAEPALTAARRDTTTRET